MINNERFVVEDNGTVVDALMNLMWASQDSGLDMPWRDAERYCKKFRGGGHKDWRMPTPEELTSLYDRTKSYLAPDNHEIHVAQEIQLSCPWIWTSENANNQAANFGFTGGRTFWCSLSYNDTGRVLPVRAYVAKKKAARKAKQVPAVELVSMLEPAILPEPVAAPEPVILRTVKVFEAEPAYMTADDEILALLNSSVIQRPSETVSFF